MGTFSIKSPDFPQVRIALGPLQVCTASRISPLTSNGPLRLFYHLICHVISSCKGFSGINSLLLSNQIPINDIFVLKNAELILSSVSFASGVGVLPLTFFGYCISIIQHILYASAMSRTDKNQYFYDIKCYLFINNEC